MGLAPQPFQSLDEPGERVRERLRREELLLEGFGVVHRVGAYLQAHLSVHEELLGLECLHEVLDFAQEAG